MADITITRAVRDGGIEVTENAAAASQTIPAKYCDENAYLLVRNADTATAATITVKAGTGQRNVLGDLEVSVPAGKLYAVGPLDSMRFKALPEGSITVSVAGPATLTNVKLAVVYR